MKSELFNWQWTQSFSNIFQTIKPTQCEILLLLIYYIITQFTVQWADKTTEAHEKRKKRFSTKQQHVAYYFICISITKQLSVVIYTWLFFINGSYHRSTWLFFCAWFLFSFCFNFIWVNFQRVAKLHVNSYQCCWTGEPVLQGCLDKKVVGNRTGSIFFLNLLLFFKIIACRL